MQPNALRDHIRNLENQVTGLFARYAKARACIAEQSGGTAHAQEDAEQSLSALLPQRENLYAELMIAKQKVQRFQQADLVPGIRHLLLDLEYLQLGLRR